MPDLELDGALRALRAPSRSEHGDGGTDGLPAILTAADRRRRHGRARRIVTTAAALVVVAMVASIPFFRAGEVRVDTPPDQRPGIAFAAGGAATPEQLDRTAEIVRRRLEVAGVADPAVTVEEGGIVVRGTGPADADVLTRAVQPSVVSFRPVVRELPAGTATTPAAEQRLDATIRLSDTEPPSGTTPGILELGPSSVDGSALESVEATLDQSGRWAVNPVFRSGPAGIDRFNALAATLYAMTSAPMGRGQMAIIVNGQVLSAPTINSPAFERDRIEISGDFNQESAEQLADVLSLGSLPVTLVPR